MRGIFASPKSQSVLKSLIIGTIGGILILLAIQFADHQRRSRIIAEIRKETVRFALAQEIVLPADPRATEFGLIESGEVHVRGERGRGGIYRPLFTKYRATDALERAITLAYEPRWFQVNDVPEGFEGKPIGALVQFAVPFPEGAETSLSKYAANLVVRTSSPPLDGLDPHQFIWALRPSLHLFTESATVAIVLPPSIEELVGYAAFVEKNVEDRRGVVSKEQVPERTVKVTVEPAKEIAGGIQPPRLVATALELMPAETLVVEVRYRAKGG